MVFMFDKISSLANSEQSIVSNKMYKLGTIR